MIVLTIIFVSSFSSNANVDEYWDRPDWSERASIKVGENRSNIYELDEQTLKKWNRNGRIHALRYPVSVSGIFIPWRPLKKVLGNPSKFRKVLEKNGIEFDKTDKRFVPFTSMDSFFDWIGLAPYPKDEGEGVFFVPKPNDMISGERMGVTIVKDNKGEKLTFSCATCHATSLFGKQIIGLNNKRPRTNEVFVMAEKYLPLVHPWLFRLATGATKGETEIYRRLRTNVRSTGSISPMALGVDTSLAQVALSLAKRNDDAYITKNKTFENYPRFNELQRTPADSKPAVWWNLKYKTRWLSDGSIVEGNPIFTNFLWNEIGRGSDMKELEVWLKENKQTVMELTSSIFNTPAPKWVDFFPVASIDIEKAKRGEKIFLNSCKRCHGIYEKGWSSSDAGDLSDEQLLSTTKVKYHKRTPVKNVGTDPLRYQGMKHFADDLNKMAISKWMKTVVVPQEGYVPPPLVGIWARFPYLHNNSVPTLCDLLTPVEKRTKKFYQGHSKNPDTDFDSKCIGYPVGENAPKQWSKVQDALIDTTRSGLRNIGHEKMLLDENGKEKYSQKQKMELIEFLKTL